MSDQSDRIDISGALSVAWCSDTVHLALSVHVDGAFVSQAYLLSPITARKLAAALQTMADACDEANAAPEEAADFDAERAAIEAEYDETHP